MKAKRRKCGGCKKGFDVEGLTFVGLDAYCSPDCGTVIALKRYKAAKVAKEKAAKKEHIAQKDAFNKKDLKWQLATTQTVFNRVRKLQEYLWFAVRGIEPYCMSCQKTKMDWACGHYKTVASQGNLRFDEINTYLQCNMYCNKGLSGNISGNKNTIGYTKGIVSRFGEASGKEIIEYCETNTQIKRWTCEEVEAIRIDYLAKEKLLKIELAKHE